MKWLALLAILLLIPSALAATVSVDIFGTNATNAQSNITKIGNNSYNVTAWGTGDATKTLWASINGNASDSITFTLHNFTANRVIEVKVNSSAFNSYQADSTGTISFTRTQTIRNQTYSFNPAVNSGGYNYTWAWFWNTIFVNGVAVITNATMDKNLGNYTGIVPNASAPLSALNRSGTNVFSLNNSNISVTKQANDSYAIDLVSSGSSSSGLVAYGQVYRTAAMSFAATNTWYDVELNVSNNLVGFNFSTTANPQRITVNATGTYEIIYSLHTLSNNAGIVSRLMKDTTEIAGSGVEAGDALLDIYNIRAKAVVTNITANQYISLQAGASSTNTANAYIVAYDDANLPDLTTPVTATITIKRLS